MPLAFPPILVDLNTQLIMLMCNQKTTLKEGELGRSVKDAYL